MSNNHEIRGWVMYDWANSAFSTTVVTAFLGPYLSAIIDTRPSHTLSIGTYAIEADAFFPFCVTISVILQVLFLPILGTLADHSNLKKRLLLSFATIGSIAAASLFFVIGERAMMGGLLFIIANFSFGAALVFYNAYLPEIASPAEQDSVSSKGFAYGYVGGGLLLILNFALLHFVEDTGLAVRLSLGSAGVWWLIFTWLFPKRWLIERRASSSSLKAVTFITRSGREFLQTMREMKANYPLTLRYLIAYLIYNDGIQTVNIVATIFAASEMGMGMEQLVGIILMIQFVAAIGAVLFNRVAARIGAKRTVIITLLGWTGLLLAAIGLIETAVHVWIWAFFEALVLGSSQALSRSIFSKMVPRKREAAYFSLYEISERGTSWLGPLVFAFAVQVTGSSRFALLPITAFFLVGIALLSATDVRQAISQAGNEVPVRV